MVHTESMMLSTGAISRVEALFSDAITDEGLRSRLLRQPRAVLSGLFSSDEVQILSRLRRDEFEALGVNVRNFRYLLKTDGQKI
jgi:hypothetical protein